MSEEDWVIEKVVGKRKSKSGDQEYLIRWDGFDAESDSWHTLDALIDDLGVDPAAAEEAIAAYKPPKVSKPKKLKEDNPLWLEAQMRHMQATQDQALSQKEFNKKLAEEKAIQDQLRKEAEERDAKEREKRRAYERAWREGALFEIYSIIPSVERKERELATDTLLRPKPSNYQRTRLREKGGVPTLWNITLAYICQNLDLYDGFEHVPLEWKASMFGYLSKRNELTVDNFSVIVDPNQSVLDLTICSSSITHKHIRALHRCPGLSKFVLHDCQGVSDLALSILASNCPNLSYLDVTGSMNLQTPNLFEFKNLTYLNTERCGVQERPIDIENVWQSLVTYRTDALTLERFNEIIQLPKFRKLYIRNLTANSYAKKIYEPLPPGHFPPPLKKIPLTHLTIQSVSSIADTIWEILFGPSEVTPFSFQDLEELHAGEIHEPQIIRLLASQTNLKKLTVEYYGSRSLSSIYSPISFKEPFPALPSGLEYLDIRGKSWHPQEIAELLTRPQLQQMKYLGFKSYRSAVPLITLLRLWRADLSVEGLDVSGWLDHDKYFAPHDDHLLEWEHIGKWDAIRVNIHMGLKKIIMDHMPRLTCAVLSTLVNPKNTPNVEYLSVLGCSALTSDVLDLCGELKQLRVFCISNLTMDYVPKESNSIRVLYLDNNPTLPKWANFWKCFPALRTLLCSHFVDSVDPLLDALEEYSLHELVFGSNRWATVKGVIKIAKRVSVLKLCGFRERFLEDFEAIAAKKEIKKNWRTYTQEQFWDESEHWPLKARTRGRS